MQLEATGKPIRYRLKTGEEFILRPGVPMELPDQAATQLLQKASAMVRRVDSALAPPLQAAEDIMIEPAAANPRPVYWERADLSIVGPGRPEFLAKVGTGATERFWVIVEYQGQAIWVQSNQLRSRKAFNQQRKVLVVEPIPKDGF